MKITTGIARPLRDEHLVDVAPPLADDAASGWARRLNLFSGRALSHLALSQEQAARAGHLALRGQMLSPGVVNGLEVLIESGMSGADAALQLSAGRGISVDGEDVSVPIARRIAVRDLPVCAPAAWLDGTPPPAAPGALLAREVGATLGELIAAGKAGAFPSVGVLLLQPAIVDTVGGGDPDDQCERDGRDDAYEDWRSTDAARVLLYLWPSDWLALPTTTASLRNELAYKIFGVEKDVPPGDALPWAEFGVPLALLGFDAEWTPQFADRHAVVRQGGRPQPRTPLVGSAGQPLLWQARIAQFAEQLAESSTALVSDAQGLLPLESSLRFVPPVGALPRDVVDFAEQRQHFFPASFRIEARPVPVEQLEAAFHDSESLQAIDLTQADDVELLVPVPQAWYEPRLLQTERIDGAFADKITEFTTQRSEALWRRELLRRRADLLSETVSGQLPAYPQNDADALEDETLNGLPFANTRIHRSNARSGAHQHYFSGAATPLTLATGEALVVYVQTDAATPPKTVMVQAHTTLDASGKPAASWEHRAYWGANATTWGSDGTVSRLRLGELPTAGQWTRLEIDATAIGIVGLPVDGLAFLLVDGAANWGWAGKRTQSGDVVWLADALPVGAVANTASGVNDAWLWQDADPALAKIAEDDYGTVLTNDVRSVSARDALVQRWANSVVADDFRLLPDLGLDALIARLQDKVQRADDRIEFGFLRARTDIYRIRQQVLGSTAATRLATSPALAEIAVRGDTALASQQQLADYVKTPVASAVGTASSGSSSSSGSGTAGITMMPMLMMQPMPMMFAGTAPVSGVSTISKTPVADTVMFDKTTFFEAEPVSKKLMTADLNASLITSGARYGETEVLAASPLIGAVQNTVTVAERLQEPAAVEARNFAIEGKLSAVTDISGFLNGAGIKVDDIALPGYSKLSGSTRVQATLADLNLSSLKHDDADEPQEKHEAAYFSAGVRVIDNTIALFRLLEGRVQTYRNAIDDCTRVRSEIGKLAAALQTRLRAVADDLAEARHDVAVARALRDEEQQRLDAINARRRKILAEQVNAIVFRRPRFADALLTVPTRALNPGDLPSPVPACLSGHDGVPEELRSLVALFRDVPLRWLPPLLPLLDHLDRIDVLGAAFSIAKNRAATQIATPAVALASGAPLALAISQLTVQQTQRVALARSATAQFSVATLANAGWRELRVQAPALLAIGDLLDAARGRAELSRRLSEALDQIAQVAACLYARFGDMPPALRLAWATTLSEFDAPPPLRNLAGLARWSELPYETRRDAQALVDWLYGRVDQSDAQATGLVADLVRVCILLASHAPVDQIIAGHLPAPVLVRPGVRVDVAVDLSRLRIGMPIVVHGDDARVVARGVVEDLAGGVARARVTETAQASVQLTTTMRVQFSNSALLQTAALGVAR